jgi:hypothetical protein
MSEPDNRMLLSFTRRVRTADFLPYWVASQLCFSVLRKFFGNFALYLP